MSEFLINKTNNIINTKTYIYLLDSRDRDIKLYPNPSNYKIPLEREYNNIKSIELLSCYLPSVIYNINYNNNLLHISINNKLYKLSCDIGLYKTGEDICNNINNTINNKLSNKYIKFIYNKNTHKIICNIINIKENITLHFGDNYNKNTYIENSIGFMLGFLPIDYNIECDSNIILNKVYQHTKKEISYLINTKYNLTLLIIKYKCYINYDDDKYIIINKAIYKDTNTWLISINKDIHINNCKLYINKIEATNIMDIYQDKYILLELPKSSRYENNNRFLRSSFVEIPIVSFLPYASDNILGVKKIYNPLIHLKELEISFYHYQKDIFNKNKLLFNFNGGNHILTFGITCII